MRDYAGDAGIINMLLGVHEVCRRGGLMIFRDSEHANGNCIFPEDSASASRDQCMFLLDSKGGGFIGRENIPIPPRKNLSSMYEACRLFPLSIYFAFAVSYKIHFKKRFATNSKEPVVLRRHGDGDGRIVAFFRPVPVEKGFRPC